MPNKNSRYAVLVKPGAYQPFAGMYRMAQNFEWEKIGEFDEFPAIRQYFPIKIFHLVSYLPLMNLWQSGSTRNKII